MLRRLIREDIELETVTDAKLGTVKADAGQIEQVVMNLVVNARDAIKAGGRITIETANVTLDEDCVREHGGARPGAHVMLAVSDTGERIPSDVLPYSLNRSSLPKRSVEVRGLASRRCTAS